jgi:hypothetical protein
MVSYCALSIRVTLRLCIWIAAIWTAHDGQLAAAQAPVTVYRLLCDASAAISLSAAHFIVANDERNVLRIYRRGQADPIESVDLATFLDTSANKESDLEGAATIGDRVYWISSHGRNKEGEVQKRRYRFFATQIVTGSAAPSVRPVGKAYRDLLSDLIAAPQLAAYNLEDAAKLAPEAKGGLNIGLRNPNPDGKALVVPLANPGSIVANETAEFGEPIQLDLKGRGIRGIERIEPGYLIIAGPAGDTGQFALYRWSGDAGDQPKELDGVSFNGLHPEALFAVPGTDRVQILSDDGGEQVEGQNCKDQIEAKQSFRSIIVSP